jgi:hypothetical protein
MSEILPKNPQELRALIRKQDAEIAALKERARSAEKDNAMLTGRVLAYEDDFPAVAKERDALRERAENVEDENTDLHLACQGVKHYWQCRNNVAANSNEPPCVRCRLEAAEADAARTREALERFMKPRYSLGASHPHLSAYVAYDDEVWEQARAALAQPVPEKEGRKT